MSPCVGHKIYRDVRIQECLEAEELLLLLLPPGNFCVLFHAEVQRVAWNPLAHSKFTILPRKQLAHRLNCRGLQPQKLVPLAISISFFISSLSLEPLEL